MTAAQSRRTEYSEATRRALVDSAVELFTERGYTEAPLDEIARRARVTKGALYHHFGGKQALFEAAFEAVETDVVARLERVMLVEGDVWNNMRAGLDAFLRACLEPAFQRIVAQEGPVVMGFDRWREADERYTFGMVRRAVAALVDSGDIDPSLPVDSLARVIFGGLSAGAATIVNSATPRRTSVEIGECVERLMQGLRTGGCPDASRPRDQD